MNFVLAGFVQHVSRSSVCSAPAGRAPAGSLGWPGALTHRAANPSADQAVAPSSRPGPEQTELLETCWTTGKDEIHSINDMRSDVQRQQIIGPFQRLTDSDSVELVVQSILSRPGVA